MTQGRPLEGITVVEVAMWGFVPSCGALLAEWGADVIKVEHARTGDPQRQITQMGEYRTGEPNSAWVHPNHGKRSIGLDIAHPDGRALLSELVADADVFLTSFLPDARKKLSIEPEDVLADNPRIIYARGSALGAKGDEAAAGGYDATAFWMRAGVARAITPRDLEGVIPPPGPAFGDTISGTNLAGGIAAALFRRERTGKGAVVDVSLLGSGVWAMGLGVDASLLDGHAWLGNPAGLYVAPNNPLAGTYRTQDDRLVMLMMLQPSRYWTDTCMHLERPDLINDARFATPEALGTNAAAATEILREVLAARTLAEWTERFRSLDGPWAPIQDTVEVTRDQQVRANDVIVPVVELDGTPAGYELVAGPVQFDGEPAVLTRAPEFAEHTELLLLEKGVDWDRIAALKEAGVLT